MSTHKNRKTDWNYSPSQVEVDEEPVEEKDDDIKDRVRSEELPEDILLPKDEDKPEMLTPVDEAHVAVSIEEKDDTVLAEPVRHEPWWSFLRPCGGCGGCKQCDKSTVDREEVRVEGPRRSVSVERDRDQPREEV